MAENGVRRGYVGNGRSGTDRHVPWANLCKDALFLLSRLGEIEGKKSAAWTMGSGSFLGNSEVDPARALNDLEGSWLRRITTRGEAWMGA